MQHSSFGSEEIFARRRLSFAHGGVWGGSFTRKLLCSADPQEWRTPPRQRRGGVPQGKEAGARRTRPVMVSPRRTGRRAALTKKRVAAARSAESMAVRYHQGPGAADGPLGQILRIGEDQPRSRPIRAMRRTPLRSRVRENGGGAAKSAAPKKVATERAGRAAEEETTTRATGTTIRAAITVAAAAPNTTASKPARLLFLHPLK